MYLIYGVLVLFAVALFWSIALILCRRLDAGWYSKEFMQAYFWAPLGASGLLLGGLMIFTAFIKFSPSILELTFSAIILSITVVIYRWLGKWVQPVDASVARTKTKISPFGVKDRAKKQASLPINPHESEFKRAA